jgi:predicted nuclease of predicted toxin-antitoxin system
VRVLLDENLPHDFAGLLTGHDVDTVAGRGWAGVQNGELMRRTSSDYQAFLTMDRRLPDQQRVDGLPFAVVLVLAPSNRLSHLAPLIPAILRALGSAVPGTLTVVGA